MTSEQFCYWLQGLLETKGENDFLSLKETLSVRDHLSTVFTKVTPDRSQARERDIDNAIHLTKRVC